MIEEDTGYVFKAVAMQQIKNLPADLEETNNLLK